MAEKSNIAWCDSTVNFWRGCTKVSPGCANCYAETLVSTRLKGGKFVRGVPRVLGKGAIASAFAMNRKPWICDECGQAFPDCSEGQPAHNKPFDSNSHSWALCHGKGQLKTFHRRRIFSLSLGDWLDKEVCRSWFSGMLYTVYRCDAVVWILCTKRPENWRELVASILTFDESKNDVGFRTWLSDWLIGTPPKNIILLASVENQEMADKRIPQLLSIPASCRGLSLEPLLGPVDLKLSARSFGFPQHITEEGHAVGMLQGLHWLIPGCESGPGRRDCDGAWVRHLVEQGKTAGVAVFVKQILVGGQVSHDPTQWPEWARVQRWPNGF